MNDSKGWSMRAALVVGAGMSVLLLSCYASAIVGFGLGRWQAAPSEAPARAVVITRLLRSVRANQDDQVTKLLETMLDAEILAHQRYQPKISEWLGWPLFGDDARQEWMNKLKQLVVDYRHDYPRQPTDTIEQEADAHLTTWDSDHRIAPVQSVIEGRDGGTRQQR